MQKQNVCLTMSHSVKQEQSQTQAKKVLFYNNSPFRPHLTEVDNSWLCSICADVGSSGNLTHHIPFALGADVQFPGHASLKWK